MESEEDSKFFSLQKLLNQIKEDPQTTHLFLLGDIFDLWVADHAYFNRKFANTLYMLSAIHERGVEIHYFEGNHDLDLKPYFERRGVGVHEGPLQLTLGAREMRLEHGDQMDPEDRGYLFLRWLLRTPWMRWIGRHLPGFGVQRLGALMSSTSRKYTNRLKANLAADEQVRKEKIFEKIREHVRKTVESGENFDLFIAGHTHERFQEKLAVGEKRIEVINLGSWLGEEKPYLILQKTPEQSFATPVFKMA